ncbi:methionyl-tRNA formyltransferase [Caldisalinibacter kiritimatiensis]|uniref:Methionyl-tRNA formyltransferase n=1 Tax=Caldisalinibacter kiritimatiensis TaxID=1304284 RepID=R1CXG6_9FIRM|nr:methionyl-tRNA formyltransferase [Caldisalinibacter kiritimatiensis]EOD01314.1 Methionyl-tRNA formyltransferase [Caldisalinibacter kiritimatiensis]
MKVVFMGTPEFAVPTLEHLYQEGYDVSLVVTQPDRPKGRGKKLSPPPVKEKALEYGIEVYQPKNVNTSDSIQKIKEISPDVIVVVAYGQILKEEVLNIPRFGCINVHASLLPKYRGAAPINWVIINGEKCTGITTMYMDKGLDTGDMILKETIEIDENMTAEELHDKLKDLGAFVLIKTLKEVEKGTALKIPQEHEEATYAPMLKKSTGKIDWSKNAEVIDNLVRGTNPWPGAYFEHEGKKIKVFRVEKDITAEKGKIGEVIKVNDNGIFVKVKDGHIIIKELQFPGKRRMKVSDYLKGNEFPQGIILK